MELNIHGCTLASFVIERNGTVSEVTLLNTSTVDPYDKAPLPPSGTPMCRRCPRNSRSSGMTSTFGFFITSR